MMASHHPLTPLDVVDYQFPRDAQIAPEGRRVVFCLQSASKTDSAELPSELWIADVTTGQSQRLTQGRGTDQSPRWAPDSRRVAFLSDTATSGQRQLVVLDIETGESRIVTGIAGSVDSPLWSPDGRAIAFIHAVTTFSTAGPDPHVEDAVNCYGRVWLADLETGEVQPLTPDGYHVHEFAWSPFGDRIAVIATANDATPSGWYRAQLYTLNIARPDTLRQVCTTQRQICGVTWSTDGQRLAYLNSLISDQPLWSGEVYCVDADGGTPLAITPRDMPVSITKLDWIEPDRMIFSARQLDGTSFGYLTVSTGETETLWSDYAMIADWTVPRVSVTPDGSRFTTVLERPDTPPQVYSGYLGRGTWKQLTHFDYTPLALGRMEAIRWQAADGLGIAGHIVYPVNYEPGRRYPTVMQIHGGPSWSWLPHYAVWWEWWCQYLAGRGYVVLLPNIRGSTGHGTAYAEANLNDLGGADFQDGMSGLDSLIGRGISDPDRLGIGGWSYGGFIAAWAVTQTTRFKAAIMGAGIANWESYYAQNNIRAWQEAFFGSTPYEDPAAHRQRSPIHYIRQARTPTLILHGQDDQDVGLPQAYEMYVALKSVGVETELVTYPREKHPILKRDHQIDLLTRVGDWFDRYLKT